MKNDQIYWPGTNIPVSRGNAFDVATWPATLGQAFYKGAPQREREQQKRDDMAPKRMHFYTRAGV